RRGRARQVEGATEPLPINASVEHKALRAGFEKLGPPLAKSRCRLAQHQASAGEGERRRPLVLNIDAERTVRFTWRKPWRSARKAEIGRAGLPRHRRPGAVAAQ